MERLSVYRADGTGLASKANSNPRTSKPPIGTRKIRGRSLENRVSRRTLDWPQTHNPPVSVSKCVCYHIWQIKSKIGSRLEHF